MTLPQEALATVKVRISATQYWAWEVSSTWSNFHPHDAAQTAIVWTDVTALCSSISIDRGRSGTLTPFGVGKCDLTFIDPAGTLAGAEYKPGKVVEVTATDSSATLKPLFRGYIDHRSGGITWDYVDGIARAKMRCYDLMGLINTMSYPASTGGRVSDRWESIVTGAWPGQSGPPYVVMNGRALVDWSDASDLNAEQCAAIEQGGVYARADGVVVYDARWSMFDEVDRPKQFTSQATFSDDGADFGYANAIEYTTTDKFGSFTVNDYTHVSASVETSWWPNAAISIPALRDADGIETRNLAKAMLRQHAADRREPVAVRVYPSDTAMWNQCVNRDLRDKVEIEYNPPGAEGQRADTCWIESVGHNITPGSWITTYGLSNEERWDWADPYGSFIVGTTENRSKVGTGKVAP